MKESVQLHLMPSNIIFVLNKKLKIWYKIIYPRAMTITNERTWQNGNEKKITFLFSTKSYIIRLCIKKWPNYGLPKICYNQGNLICRWDNANHWPDISTSPHHKHTGNKVFESTKTSIGDVLNRISKKLGNVSNTHKCVNTEYNIWSVRVIISVQIFRKCPNWIGG